MPDLPSGTVTFVAAYLVVIFVHGLALAAHPDPAGESRPRAVIVPHVPLAEEAGAVAGALQLGEDGADGCRPDGGPAGDGRIVEGDARERREKGMEIMQATRKEVRAVLTADQQKKFDDATKMSEKANELLLLARQQTEAEQETEQAAQRRGVLRIAAVGVLEQLERPHRLILASCGVEIRAQHVGRARVRFAWQR